MNNTISPETIATLGQVLEAVKNGPVRVHAGAILTRTTTTLVEGYGLHFRKIGDDVIFARQEDELEKALA